MNAVGNRPLVRVAGTLEAVGLAALASALFVFLAMEWTFTLTPPSDPLEYVGAALAPQAGFPYLDRVALWLWLRAFALLPIPPEYIGPIATLAQTVLILALGVYWLSRKIGPIAGALFGGLYMLSPMILGIATYTYPIQMMTLVLLGVAFLNAGPPRAISMAATGVGMLLALLSKVQAGGVAVVLLLRALGSPQRARWIMLMGLGGVAALAATATLLALLDGPEQPLRVVELFFFGGVGEKQFAGVAAGGVPPFYEYLAEPTALLAVIGAALPWMWSGGKQMRIFSLFAIAQTLFLLAVYVVTQRGGALISNYSFDALVFGLVAFSGVAGGLLQGRVSRFVPYLLLAGCYLSTEGLARIEGEAAQFNPQVLPKLLSGLGLEGIAYLFVIPALAFTFWGVSKATGTNQRAATALMVGAVGVVSIFAVLYSGKGPAYGAYHRNWALPYHELAHRIMAETEPVCLDVRMGNASAEVANWRMEWLLADLYRRPHSFSGEINEQCRVAYSERLDSFDGVAEMRPGEFRYGIVRQDRTTSELEYFAVGNSGS